MLEGTRICLNLLNPKLVRIAIFFFTVCWLRSNFLCAQELKLQKYNSYSQDFFLLLLLRPSDCLSVSKIEARDAAQGSDVFP